MQKRVKKRLLKKENNTHGEIMTKIKTKEAQSPQNKDEESTDIKTYKNTQSKKKKEKVANC